MIESKKIFQINKNYKEWKIILIANPDSITINISKSKFFYQNNYKIKFFHQYKLFNSNLDSNSIIEKISTLIDNNNIEIKETEETLKINIIPNKKTETELILYKKELVSEEIIIMLINKIDELESENKKIKKEIEENKKETNKKIEILQKENTLIKKDIEYLKKEIKNKDEQLTEIDKKIAKIEELKPNKKKIQLTNSNLKKIKTVNARIYWINSISVFPSSGNIISVSDDKTIKIYDQQFNEIQTIQNAHNDSIIYVSIKDEKNFVTCSSDKSIKTWNKKYNEFKQNIHIENAHDDSINKIIYDSKSNLYSCSWDETIKIWELNNNSYEKSQILLHSNKIYSIILFENKNLLISSGNSGTKIWDLNKLECLTFFKEAECYSNNDLKKIDDDKFIVGGKDDFITIISINEKKIIKNIDNKFKCWGICVINDKGVFLTGGYSKDIRVYRSDNYECIQIVKDNNNDNINGIIELINGTIATYSDDKSIKIWSF